MKFIIFSAHVKLMEIVGSLLNGARHSILTSCCDCAPASIVEPIGFGCIFKLKGQVKKTTFVILQCNNMQYRLILSVTVTHAHRQQEHAHPHKYTLGLDDI